MKTKIKKLCEFFLLTTLLVSFRAHTDEIKVMSYNLCNYFVKGDRLSPLKSDFSKEALMQTIKTGDPDILIALEVGRENSLANLIKNLEEAGLNYTFFRHTQGEDDTRHIAIFSRLQPKEIIERKDLKYKIKAKDSDTHDEISTQRALVHAIFEFKNNYRLHIVGAHLKARLFHPRYNQTDMRRYEARLLRYLVNEILEKEPDANILVMGDLNDTYDSEPIRALRDDKKKPQLRLYDLRPPDKWNLYWTHWWNQNDAYSRIDYAFASYALLPEIDQNKSCIVHLPEYWMFASDHRPLMIVINTENKEPFNEEFLNKKFPLLPETKEEINSEINND